MSSLVEIGQVVLENKMIMWKVYDDNNDNDDNDRQRTNFYQKSSLDPSAKWAKKEMMRLKDNKNLKYQLK